MLPIYILSKYNTRSLNGVLYQWLNVSVRWCSSSDSSDSDSDNEKLKKRKTIIKSTKSTTPDNRNNLGTFLDNMIQQNVSPKAAKDPEKTSLEKAEQKNAETAETTGSISLTEYLNNMIKARKLEKSIDVAVQPRKKMIKKAKTHVSYEKKLVSAAEDVASMLGKDKTKTVSDLLQKVLSYKAELPKENAQPTHKTDKTKSNENLNLMEFIKLRKNTPSSQSPEHEKQESSTNDKYSAKKSIIHALLHEYQHNQRSTKNVESTEKSISWKLLQDAKTSAEHLQNNDKRKYRAREELDIWNGKPSYIFENMGAPAPNIPELKTWTALQQRELKAFTTYPPANVFQELILWTEQGKLWKFPIDNEQGLEEEHNVHFSEHVFMERHLKDWCPKAGPISHFMELVCTGLSKNPYMTVQEKINHIMWYKEYFESKQDLLQEVGAIQEPFPDKIKQIEE